MKTLRRISKNRAFAHVRVLAAVLFVLAAAALVFLAASPPAAAQRTARPQPLTPTFSKAVAFDVSPALRDLPRAARPLVFDPNKIVEVRPERGGSEGPQAHGVKPYSADGVLQLFNPAPTIPAPLLTFEGMSNQDNFNIFGFRVNPPDPNGEVGRNNFVEMINLVCAVYDNAGNLLAGPIDTGSLLAGFAIPDCTDPSGDPVVLYDKFEDRWLLSQFTTSGLRKEPAILKFIIQHDRVTGRIRAVWDGEARQQRTCVYRPRQQVASVIINCTDQVDHFHKIITADFTVGVRRVHSKAEDVEVVLIRHSFEGQQGSRDGRCWVEEL